ncbi:MAG: hypothetical protein LJE96_01090 [Deltaproteobacteria bacterium]|nr:hypothetical protein [Deltaproteobacteria bacterium]
MKPFQNRWPLKKTKAPELKALNVLATKGAGRVWCFNINFWLLIGIAGALILYLLFSFLLVARFFGEYQQQRLLKQLETDFRTTRKALYQAKQRLKFLENYIDPSKIPEEGTKETQNPEAAPGQNKTSISSDGKFSKASESALEKSIFVIQDMEINSRDNSLSTTFKLARSSPGGSPVRGYLFVLAVDRSTDPPRIWSSPKAVIENGIPVNPQKGQAFKIRNFRRIRARWTFESVGNLPSDLKILVYDKSESLLFAENYQLKKN